MKIVFFGTADIGQTILQSLNQKHEVLAVVTSPDKPVGRKQILTPSPIAELANQLNIPVLKPEKIKNNEVFSNQLRTLNADIFIVVAYGKILPKIILDIPPLKTLNVHFSLLPKYRGAAPVQFALLNGEVKTGTTIMLMDELLDHGPILAQQELDIDPEDTNQTLQNKLANISTTLLLKTLTSYQAGQISPQEQNHDEASLTTLIEKSDGQIYWDLPAKQIYNQWRAFTPWPGIYTFWNGQRLKILNCKIADTQTPAPGPGITENNLVHCGNNTMLELIEVQLEGKNPTDIQTFLNSHTEFKNSLLK